MDSIKLLDVDFRSYAESYFSEDYNVGNNAVTGVGQVTSIAVSSAVEIILSGQTATANVAALSSSQIVAVTLTTVTTTGSANNVIPQQAGVFQLTSVNSTISAASLNAVQTLSRSLNSTSSEAAVASVSTSQGTALEISTNSTTVSAQTVVSSQILSRAIAKNDTVLSVSNLSSSSSVSRILTNNSSSLQASSLSVVLSVELQENSSTASVNNVITSQQTAIVLSGLDSTLIVGGASALAGVVVTLTNVSSTSGVVSVATSQNNVTALSGNSSQVVAAIPSMNQYRSNGLTGIFATGQANSSIGTSQAPSAQLFSTHISGETGNVTTSQAVNVVLPKLHSILAIYSPSATQNVNFNLSGNSSTGQVSNLSSSKSYAVLSVSVNGNINSLSTSQQLSTTTVKVAGSGYAGSVNVSVVGAAIVSGVASTTIVNDLGISTSATRSLSTVKTDGFVSSILAKRTADVTHVTATGIVDSFGLTTSGSIELTPVNTTLSVNSVVTTIPNGAAWITGTGTVLSLVKPDPVNLTITASTDIGGNYINKYAVENVIGLPSSLHIRADSDGIRVYGDTSSTFAFTKKMDYITKDAKRKSASKISDIPKTANLYKYHTDPITTTVCKFTVRAYEGGIEWSPSDSSIVDTYELTITNNWQSNTSDIKTILSRKY